jgi:hypothetical protein
VPPPQFVIFVILGALVLSALITLFRRFNKNGEARCNCQLLCTARS